MEADVSALSEQIPRSERLLRLCGEPKPPPLHIFEQQLRLQLPQRPDPGEEPHSETAQLCRLQTNRRCDGLRLQRTRSVPPDTFPLLCQFFWTTQAGPLPRGLLQLPQQRRLSESQRLLLPNLLAEAEKSAHKWRLAVEALLLLLQRPADIPLRRISLLLKCSLSSSQEVQGALNKNSKHCAALPFRAGQLRDEHLTFVFETRKKARSLHGSSVEQTILHFQRSRFNGSLKRAFSEKAASQQGTWLLSVSTEGEETRQREGRICADTS